MTPDFAVRNKRLAAAGFRSYQAYLASPEWAAHQRHVQERSGWHCEACTTRRASQVHHFTYENLPHEEPWDVAHLCGDCHVMAHKGNHAAIYAAVQATWNGVVAPLIRETEPESEPVAPPFWDDLRGELWWRWEECKDAMRVMWGGTQFLAGIFVLAELVVLIGAAILLLGAVVAQLATIPTLADLPGAPTRLLVWFLGLLWLVRHLTSTAERTFLRLARLLAGTD